MKMYRVSYSYFLPEFAEVDLDLDENLHPSEREEEALLFLKTSFDSLQGIQVEDVEELEVIDGAN